MQSEEDKREFWLSELKRLDYYAPYYESLSNSDLRKILAQCYSLENPDFGDYTFNEQDQILFL